MKFFATFVLGLLVAVGAMTILEHLHEPAEAEAATMLVEVEMGPAAAPGDDLLAMVNHCAEQLFPKARGAGEQPLRFDSLSLRPYGHHFGNTGGIYALPEPTTTLWRVRVEEEHPHRTIPHGIEFAVTPDGTCQSVIRD